MNCKIKNVIYVILLKWKCKYILQPKFVSGGGMSSNFLPYALGFESHQ